MEACIPQSQATIYGSNLVQRAKTSRFLGQMLNPKLNIKFFGCNKGIVTRYMA